MATTHPYSQQLWRWGKRVAVNLKSPWVPLFFLLPSPPLPSPSLPSHPLSFSLYNLVPSSYTDISIPKPVPQTFRTSPLVPGATSHLHSRPLRLLWVLPPEGNTLSLQQTTDPPNKAPRSQFTYAFLGEKPLDWRQALGAAVCGLSSQSWLCVACTYSVSQRWHSDPTKHAVFF